MPACCVRPHDVASGSRAARGLQGQGMAVRWIRTRPLLAQDDVQRALPGRAYGERAHLQGAAAQCAQAQVGVGHIVRDRRIADDRDIRPAPRVPPCREWRTGSPREPSSSVSAKTSHPALPAALSCTFDPSAVLHTLTRPLRLMASERASHRARAPAPAPGSAAGSLDPVGYAGMASDRAAVQPRRPPAAIRSAKSRVHAPAPTCLPRMVASSRSAKAEAMLGSVTPRRPIRPWA